VTARWLLGPALGAIVAAAALSPTRRENAPPEFAQPRPAATWPSASPRAAELRADALRRAKVWQPADPRVVDFSENLPDPAGTLSGSIIRCRFLSKPAHGTTTKFDCVLPDGEVVKVKYGGTGEIPAEIAGTSLLRALGFGADRMYVVPRVRCYGCPRFPFYLTWALDRLRARDVVTRHLPDDRYTDFEWAVVERRFEGTEIKAGRAGGWAWYELDRVDPSLGATRAEIDALRVTAMLLAHWDNKAENQRLVCQDTPASGGEPCPHVQAVINDLGATFGPNKVDLASWQATTMWADPKRCVLSMRELPYGGGTFPDVEVTEAGRQLIARQLEALSDHQMVSLFQAARFPEYFGDNPRGDPRAWAQVLRDKIRQVSTAGPCPS